MAKRSVKPEQKPYSKTLKNKGTLEEFNKQYEIKSESKLTQANSGLLNSIKDIPTLFQKLVENNGKPNLEIEARVFHYNKKEKQSFLKKLNTKQFIEAYKVGNRQRTLKEGFDSFVSSGFDPSLVGQDSVPLLGGPFNKQLYLQDYLQMTSQAYFAFNHDPIANAIVNITRDFVIGRGFRVDIKADDDATKAKATAIWRAFEDVNDLAKRMDNFCIELSIYGEQMVWWLPDHETKITYQVGPNQMPPKGLIPRFRLIDPTVIWDICTMPEDIERVLFYQWLAPTQYQLFTGKLNGDPVPVLKFIYQQIPAEQIDHYKVNSVSNEKRGRSDLFPILGYLKRLRDSVNYSIIGMQKATAWAIDTIVDGNQQDIDSYIDGQNAAGTIAPAGSEFVHSTKIERKYLSNEGSSRGGQSSAFEWALSMVCAGAGIPVNWLGTHLSGGQTRASAVVATQPVDKKMEARRLVIDKCLKKMAKRVFEQFGVDAQIEVTFPELISQDRSAKLKDLALSQNQKWLSAETCANITAKEFDLSEYEYELEQEKIKEETALDEFVVVPETGSPLTSPGTTAPSGTNKGSEVTGTDENKVRKNDVQ